MTKKIWTSFVEDSGRFLRTPNGPGDMSGWMKDINQKFHQYSFGETKVVDYFGNNGNFVLNSTLTNDSEIIDFFCSSTGHNAILLDLSHLYWLIQEVCSIPDRMHRKKSFWNEGAAFQLKGTKKYFDEFHVDQNRIWCIKRGTAGVNRAVISRSDLSNSIKEVRPEWSKISKGLSAKLGGKWIARSLFILNGVLERSLLFLSREPR